MKLYKIPILKRVVNVTGFPTKTEIMRVDEIGIFLLYDEEWQKEAGFIRRHLKGDEGDICIVEASSPREAIKKFHTEYDGAKIGGKRRKERAMWINEKEYIFELPYCELLYRNKEGEFICGELSEEGDGNQGERGMCVLEGYDAPKNCMISEFYENWQQKSVPFVIVGGFKIVESLSY